MGRRELKRLRRLLMLERKHQDQLKAKAAASEKEVTEVRRQLFESESQLRLCRDESDRRRGLITALQKRCAAADVASKEEQDVKRDSEDIVRRLHAAQRDLVRRDAYAQELRAEVTECKQRLLDQRQREEADVARSRSLRANCRRQDQALRNARSEAESLEARLAKSEEKAQERQLRQALQMSAPCTAPLSTPPSKAAQSVIMTPPPPTVRSFIEDSALEDSLQILNLRREDLLEFLTESPLPSAK